MANTKFTKFVTPKGVAGYPKLLVPDTKFNADGVYTVTLTMGPAEAQPLIDKINEAFTEEFGPKKLALLAPPYKTDEEGQVAFKFKSKSKPTLFDSKGIPVTSTELKIGSGSTMKVKGSVGPCLVLGKHYATLWMNSVQIIDLVEYNSSGFGAEEGGFVAPKDVPGEDEEEDEVMATADASEDF